MSGFVALDLSRAVYPQERLPLFEEIGYRVDADMSTIEVSKDHFLADLQSVFEARCEALDRLWDAEPWDTIMFVITGTDRLNHYLWRDYEDSSSPFHQRYLDFYHDVDRAIQQIANRLDDDTTLIVVSDHGFARQEISVNVNYLLAEHGYLKLRPTERPSYVDMEPETKAFAMDPGRIYLHRADRYPNGQLIGSEADAVEAELTELFLRLEIDGKRLVDRVERGRDVYDGIHAHRAPDLVLMAAEDVALSGRMNITELIESTPINGKHTFENSTFFYRGSAAVQLPDPMRVEDVLGVLAQANAQNQAA